MRSAVSGPSRGALCAMALISWVYSPNTAAANNDAAHALAEKFSQAGEASKRAAEEKSAKARAKAEAKEKAEAAQRQAEAAKRKAADQRAADEAEMLRNANEEAEARRKHDQQREQALIEAERQAARAEAQRLADEALKQKAEMERKAEEERRTEAARLQREVDEQRIAEEKRLDDERRIAAEKKAEDERQAEAARVARVAEERRVAEEKRRAEETRIAEEKRKAEEARIAELKRQAEEAEAKRKAEVARIAEVKRKAEEARVAEEKRREEEARVAEEGRRAAEEAHLAEQRRIKELEDAQQRTALELQREKEAEDIAEKFRLAREAREREKETRSTLGGPMPEHELPSPFIEPPATAQATYPQRVTVLVVMQPRRHGFGGRRMTANPVLCVGQECYVSNGAGSPATVMQRARALGPGNTLGRNAGACRNQTTCVFRGITLSSPMTTIQPVDMGFLRHDRRETRIIEPDRSCDASGGALYCSAPIVSTGYRAWIIPESVADKAGALVLERALDDGLPAARSASYGGGWDSTVQALPTR
jgi:hypothetical protein